tara:strand:- start:15961 stop:16287 length:327 start_codon:yes stop_codon:yes gene_type:complete
MLDKKEKLRKIAEGEKSTDYAMADRYQKSEGRSTNREAPTYSATRITVGRDRYTQSDRGMDASAWKGHLNTRGVSPAVGSGVDSFLFNDETYSMTETSRDGSPLVVRA